MTRQLCDICECTEPSKHIKFKILKKCYAYENGMTFPMWTYQPMDICDRCFKAISRLRYEKDLEDRVLSTRIDESKKYDDINQRSAYLQGVADALEEVLLTYRIDKKKGK